MDAEHILDDTKKEITDYFETQSKIITVSIAEKSSLAAGAIVSLVIIIMIASILIILLTFLLGIYLSTLYNNYVIGFGIVTSIYLFLLIITLAFRKQLIEIPVANKFIRLIFSYHE